MSSRRPGLGKGLDALIPAASPDKKSTGAGVLEIDIQQITPNPHQPRTTFDEEALKDLAASIKEHGVIQPLIVTQGGQPDQYFLIAGERRWQASKRAGLAVVPVILREATQQDMLLLALIENVQRADLNPLETAQAYNELAEQFKLTHEQIADRVGKSRPAVSNTLKLLEAAPDVLQALLDSQISEGHARALQGLVVQTQNAAVAAVMKSHLSVRQTEQLARRLKELPEHQQVAAVRDVIKKHLYLEPEASPPAAAKKNARAKSSTVKSPELAALEAELTEAMEFKTSITPGVKGGRITIEYYDEEDLNTLTDKLLKR